jgi:hypothetical protein
LGSSYIRLGLLAAKTVLGKQAIVHPTGNTNFDALDSMLEITGFLEQLTKLFAFTGKT